MKFRQLIEQYPVQIILSLIVISLLFIIAGHNWRDTIQTPLKKSYLTLPAASFDGWSILHFALFAVFGFVMPDHFWKFLALGVSWELIEDYLAADHETQLSDCSTPHTTSINGEQVKKFWCNGVQTDYWYGKWDDILANSLGYLTGQFLRKRFMK